MDAPDGAVVDGYERVGDRWVLQMKTYYVTKYCLSQGVFKVRAAASSVEGYINTEAAPDAMSLHLKIGRDAFENAADAYKRAIQIAEARDKGLERMRRRIRELRAEWKKQC